MGSYKYLTYTAVSVGSFLGGSQLNSFWNGDTFEREWDENWDGRQGQTGTSATRHLLLIRHGNYFFNTSSRSERKLTELGKLQLHETGKYLKSRGFDFSKVTHSSLVRAIESCDIVCEYIPKEVPKSVDDDLCEGMPYVPIPRRESLSKARDYDRIERAFKTYFHRADPEQRKDSFEVIVCHANVIRYFVCRALQLPPSAWLRLSLFHGSVTSVSIRHNGHVCVNSLGDIGFMPPSLLSR